MNNKLIEPDGITFHSNPDHGQDRWVIEQVFPGVQKGYFIEAGASGGSNTQTLENFFGWTGIGVEPHPDSFQDIQKERTCILENVCLMDRRGEVEFVLNDAIPGTSMVAGISQKLTDIFYNTGQNYRTIKVDGYPLWSLLEKHNSPKVIDYLSLDVEGAEWMVLKDFPFDIYSFRCMTIERGADDYHKLRALLFREGYKLVKIANSNDYWLHPSMDYKSPNSDRLYVVLRTWLDLHPFFLRIAQNLRNMLPR